MIALLLCFGLVLGPTCAAPLHTRQEPAWRGAGATDASVAAPPAAPEAKRVLPRLGSKQSGQEPAYDFELYDLESKLFSLDGLRSQEGTELVVVDFFWHGCKPCKEALPGWVALHSKLSERGLRIVIVDVRADDDIDTAKTKLSEYFKQSPVPFPVLFDKYNVVAKQFGVVSADGRSVSLPQIFLLDKDGRLVQSTAKFEEASETIEKRFGGGGLEGP